MAVGFPTKTTFADGNTLPASDLNDITGTLNSLVDRSTQTFQIPYAISTGSFNTSGTAVITGGNISATVVFTTAARFTQPPIVLATQTSLPSGSSLLIPKLTSSATTGFTAYLYNAASTTTTWTNAQYSYIAIQMTSAASVNN